MGSDLQRHLVARVLLPSRTQYEGHPQLEESRSLSLGFEFPLFAAECLTVGRLCLRLEVELGYGLWTLLHPFHLQSRHPRLHCQQRVGALLWQEGYWVRELPALQDSFFPLEPSQVLQNLRHRSFFGLDSLLG